MIRAEFFSRHGGLVGFCISGHAGSGETGHDIVCAAVSSAAYLTANTITDVIGANAAVCIKGGRMSLQISEHDIVPCRDLLKGFQIHMVSLSKQYPKNISLIDMEV